MTTSPRECDLPAVEPIEGGTACEINRTGLLGRDVCARATVCAFIRASAYLPRI